MSLHAPQIQEPLAQRQPDGPPVECSSGACRNKERKDSSPDGTRRTTASVKHTEGGNELLGAGAMPVHEYREIMKKLPQPHRRLSVRPGLTGLTQVHAKSSRNNAPKLAYDLE